MRGMPMRTSGRCLLIVAAVLPLAGCFSAQGAGTSNFTLTPQAVGWYAGDEAHFVLMIESSFFHSDPKFDVDRHFALEEFKFEEEGLTFGGDFETRNPDEIGIRIGRGNETGEKFVMDLANPMLDVYVTLPGDLRDSTYTFSVKLFEVGWIDSSVFRVDHR